jgi:CheY-like chemotaxis protein
MSGTELAGFRVLVVDDDEDTRDELGALVRSAGALPLAATDGMEAYELFERERPDAIVADLWMPRMDGYDLLRRVRWHAPEDGGPAAMRPRPRLQRSRCQTARAFHRGPDHSTDR